MNNRKTITIYLNIVQKKMREEGERSGCNFERAEEVEQGFYQQSNNHHHHKQHYHQKPLLLLLSVKQVSFRAH